MFICLGSIRICCFGFLSGLWYLCCLSGYIKPPQPCKSKCQGCCWFTPFLCCWSRKNCCHFAVMKCVPVLKGSLSVPFTTNHGQPRTAHYMHSAHECTCTRTKEDTPKHIAASVRNARQFLQSFCLHLSEIRGEFGWMLLAIWWPSSFPK